MATIIIDETTGTPVVLAPKPAFTFGSTPVATVAVVDVKAPLEQTIAERIAQRITEIEDAVRRADEWVARYLQTCERRGGLDAQETADLLAHRGRIERWQADLAKLARMQERAQQRLA